MSLLPNELYPTVRTTNALSIIYFAVRSIDSLPEPPIAPYVYGEGPVISLKWEVPYMSAEECPIIGYIIETREGNQWSPIHKDIYTSTSIRIDIQKYNNCVFRIYAVNQIGKGKTCLEYLVSYKGKYIQVRHRSSKVFRITSNTIRDHVVRKCVGQPVEGRRNTLVSSRI